SFFFQAEDGIRDRTVTGVQTCALPILRPAPTTRQMVVLRSLTVPAAAIPPWVLMPVSTLPRPATLSVSARASPVRTWITAALSAIYSARHLPMELPSWLIQTAGSEQ